MHQRDLGIGGAATVLAGSLCVAVGLSCGDCWHAKNLPRTELPPRMLTFASITPGNAEMADIGAARHRRRSLGGSISGRRALSMTRSLGSAPRQRSKIIDSARRAENHVRVGRQAVVSDDRTPRPEQAKGRHLNAALPSPA